ncbi:MAG TPA: hypothetical protein VFZ40_11220, partial [Pyrinomonadaceae bacterium]
DAVSGRGRDAKRAVESMVLIAGYILEQYERAENHVSAVEGWTVVAAVILHVATREKLRSREYEQSLNLVWTAFYRSLEGLQTECLKRDHFIESRYITAERDDIRGARTMLTLGWLAAKYFIDKKNTSQESSGSILTIVKREHRALRFLGESDWPYILLLSLLLERTAGTSAGEGLIQAWIRSIIIMNRGSDPAGIPSPYWLQERVLALNNGKLAAYEKEKFSGQSYTIHSALDMLVRRLLRQAVRYFWPTASQLTFADYLPGNSAEWFLWRGYNGYMRLDDSQRSVSWSNWRQAVHKIPRNSVPEILIEDSRWLLPFALTYPHRVTREMTGVIDAVIGERADLV